MSIERTLWQDVRVTTTFTIRSSSATVLVPPGIAVRKFLTGEATLRSEDVDVLPEGDSVQVSFRLEYSESTGRFEIAGFAVDRGESAIEISSAFLRTIRVHAITRVGIVAAFPEWSHQLVRLNRLSERGGLRSFAEFVLTDEDALLLTGLLYRMAEISGENPALAVAESIGLKQRTATNWIQRARAAGYMTSTEHGAAMQELAAAIEPFWDRFVKEERDGDD